MRHVRLPGDPALCGDDEGSSRDAVEGMLPELEVTLLRTPFGMLELP